MGTQPYKNYDWWEKFVPLSEGLWKMLRDAKEPPGFRWTVNAERQGIEIRFIAYDGKPRRAFVWKHGETYLPIDPSSPAYGPDGVDTGQ